MAAPVAVRASGSRGQDASIAAPMADENPTEKRSLSDRLRSLAGGGRPEVGESPESGKPGSKPDETETRELGSDKEKTAEQPTGAEVASKSLGEKTLGRLTGSAGTGKPPEPDLPARIDGLRGWLDQIERRQQRMSYFGAAAAAIALVASGAALYLGISANRDSASKDQLEEAKAEITKLRTDLEAQQASNKKIETQGQQLTQIQQDIQQLRTKQNQQATDIAALESQPAGGGGGGGLGGAGGAATP